MIIIGGSIGHWGIIPAFLNESDPRKAAEQFNAAYIGGWRNFGRFKFDPTDNSLKYPGDPKMKPLSTMLFRDERIMIYESAWVVVLQKDGTWEVSRMD